MSAEFDGRARVAVRCRPAKAAQRANAVGLRPGANGTVELRVGEKERSYAYDTVFGPANTQV